MKVSQLPRIGLGLLLIVSLATVGCGSSEERKPEPIATENPGSSPPPAPETDAATSEELTAEASELERAEVIANRAAELDRAEARLVERMQQLDRKMFDLEERELDVGRAEIEPGYVSGGENPTDDTIPADDATPARMHVPPGTSLGIEFMDALSSELSEVGNTVRARVVGDSSGMNLDAVPAGTTLWGHVTDVRSERKIGSSARLALAFEEMELPSGQLVPIQAELVLEGAKQKNKDAATIGGSAAGGAILGRVLSKNRKKGKGTAIGAIVGAAVGAAIASENRGDPVVVEPGHEAVVELSAPAEWTTRLSPLERVAREY